MEPRRVDWPKLAEGQPLEAKLLDGTVLPELAALLSGLEDVARSGSMEAIARRAVELARDRLGLRRVAIFLWDEPAGLMRGTWGTDLEGASVDERDIAFEPWRGSLEIYERAARGGVYWTIIEDAPIVVHSRTETCVAGRGWVCCTPIRAACGTVGLMFNDAGLTSAALEPSKQAQGALLCSLLGPALESARQREQLGVSRPLRCSRVVGRALSMLAENPALTGDDLGARLKLSAGRVARVFKSEMGMSLVEYRNRLRLERFHEALQQTEDNLLEAALLAGFGSYAQFHRVFVASRGMTPGRYLRQRRTEPTGQPCRR